MTNDQRHRVRIWFRKAGDLRFISHRDLVRTWERIFRRAELQLSRSEGFHPKPRMSFPAALAVGIAGTHELVEIELVASRAAESMRGISEGAQRVVGSVNDISNALKEQSVASNDIAANVEKIAQMSEENSAATKEAAQTAQRLEQLAAQTRQAVAAFRV